MNKHAELGVVYESHQSSLAKWINRVILLAALCFVGYGVLFAQTPVRIATLPIESSSFAIADLNDDGYNEIIVVGPGPGDKIPVFCDGIGAPGSGKTSVIANGELSSLLYVYVYDGAAEPAYSRQLASLWPRLIGVTCGNYHPTVAVGDINFDGSLDVLVGGYIDERRSMFAFRADGRDVPGWEAVVARDPPFFNAPTIADVNADGAPDALFVDESCFLLRQNSLGARRQCQLVTNYAFSSPAVGDLVNNAGQSLADFLPDEITAGYPGGYGVRAYSSFGQDLSCFSGYDFRKHWGEDLAYTSSPALHDVDGDGTHDAIVQGHVTRISPISYLRVHLSSSGNDEVEEFQLRVEENSLFLGGYSSPAVVDLNGDGVINEIVIGTDSGYLVALYYNRDRPSGQRLQLLWERLLDSGYSISSSPLVVDLDQDGLMEVVTAGDGGRVHIINGQNGTPIAAYDLLNGEPWSDSAAIYSTPAVGARQQGDPPMLVAANRRGIFTITLDQYPAFDAAHAPWPTFHGNNARTGSYPFKVIGTRGSIGGTAMSCTEIQLRTADCSEVIRDYYGGSAVTRPKSDGRFVFEMLQPGRYCVRYIGSNTPDWLTEVAAGAMSYQEVDCR